MMIKKILRPLIENLNKEPVHLIDINPKSITLNNLFGFTNVLTNEWNDGLVSLEVN
jgi:hypothetical protein